MYVRSGVERTVDHTIRQAFCDFNQYLWSPRMEIVQRILRVIRDRAGPAGLTLLGFALLVLAFLPTELAWWPARIAGGLALVFATAALFIQPSPSWPAAHRRLGSLAIVAVSAHVLLVAAIEPVFWRWLTPAIPLEIAFGIAAALGLFATLAVRRSHSLRSGIGAIAILTLHRIAGFVVCIAAAAHVALIAGMDRTIILMAVAGTALIVLLALLREKQALLLLSIPAILFALAGLAVGPLSGARLADLRASPVDHASFDHGDHTGFICTTCHHNFTDRTGTENCLTCHKKLSVSETMRIDRLFHAFCTDCHRRETQAGRKSGPLDRCTACHGS